MSDVILQLPAAVATKRDFYRLVAEFEQLDNQLTTESATSRSGVAQTAGAPVSDLVDGFLQLNQLDTHDERQRSDVLGQLRQLAKTIPVMHVTFASRADGESIQKLIVWLRQAVDPRIVIEVGLQPDLVAGVYIRATNQVFDRSLRQQLKSKRPVLQKLLGELHAT